MKKFWLLLLLFVFGILITGCKNKSSSLSDINKFDWDIIYWWDSWWVPIKWDKVMYYNTWYWISFIIWEDLSWWSVKEYDWEEYDENTGITINNHFIVFSMKNGISDSMKFFIYAIPNEEYVVLVKDANREYNWGNNIIWHNNKYTFIMVADKLYFSDLQIYELPTESNSSNPWKSNYRQESWDYVPSTECYDYNWFLIDNPEKDKEWDIVNCYNNKWWRNWKQIWYYENWAISYEAMYKDWSRDGKQIEYYENWQIKIEGNYKDWQKDGKQIWYYENWQIEIEENYKDWEIEGKQVHYYENWQIKSERNYKDWETDGKQIWYHEDWSISYETNYKNWKKDGRQIEYYENWQVRYEENYKNWKEEGEQVHYYENWQVEYEHNYIDWIMEDGEVITYDSDWTIIFRGTYKNWKRID